MTKNGYKWWCVRGRVVTAVELEQLDPHHRWFVSRQEFWILSCEEAIQLVYGTGSTQVPARA